MELRRKMAQLASKDRFSFHMPGHKGRFPGLFGQYDPTELPGLDNLHDPRNTLKDAQDRVAEIYGAAKTFFLVNGSSGGIMAAITALIRPGELVLTPRNCHKSVLAGLILSGAMPLWVDQTLCPTLGHWLPPTAAALEGALAPSIRAAILTSPDYYGYVPDLASFIGACKKRATYLIVDEAHGAHLHWGHGLGLPPSALPLGADLVVQSPHKTLPALTQSAWLHVKNPALAGPLQETLNILHTTSPSYLLLRSLEFAGTWADTWGAAALRRLYYLAKALSLRSRQLGLELPLARNRDWSKFLLPRRRGTEALLRSRGIYPELVQGNLVLFMLTMADALAPAGIAALYALLPSLAALSPMVSEKISPPPFPRQEITPREAWEKPGQRVPLARARGRISRQVLAPYPPGTMLLCPGQRLETEHVEYLLDLQAKKVIPSWLEVI